MNDGFGLRALFFFLAGLRAALRTFFAFLLFFLFAITISQSCARTARVVGNYRNDDLRAKDANVHVTLQDFFSLGARVNSPHARPMFAWAHRRNARFARAAMR
jgi:hypothetical protein